MAAGRLARLGTRAGRLFGRLARARSVGLASLGILVLVASCATPRLGVTPHHELALRAVDFSDLPGWNRDHLSEAMPAFGKSCAVFAKLPDGRAVGTRTIGGQAIGGHVADWRPACAAFAEVKPGDDAAAAAFLTANFQPYAALDRNTDQGFFTGYYETELEGSRRPDAVYATPLYRAPVPPVGYSRAEIDAGALRGKGLELLWLKDPVDAFMLQIQGSGLVRLPDGGKIRIGYAGNNGQDFVPVARLMIQAGLIPKNQASMQSVRDWLKSHPDDAEYWMQKNPRYIFFRELGGDAAAMSGPSGAMGITLTPTRSMAIDPDYLPLGAPVWLDTAAPDGSKLQRLMVAQDVGSAIKGPIRGDLFWGTGEPALEFAGRMKNPGRYYVLLPKALAARSTFMVTDSNGN